MIATKYFILTVSFIDCQNHRHLIECAPIALLQFYHNLQHNHLARQRRRICAITWYPNDASQCPRGRDFDVLIECMDDTMPVVELERISRRKKLKVGAIAKRKTSGLVRVVVA